MSADSCCFRVLVPSFATEVRVGLDAPQHHTQVVAHVRVSSTDQNLDRQFDAIGPVDRGFEEKASGRSRTERPELGSA